MDREIRELLVRIETDLGLVKAWGEVDDKGSRLTAPSPTEAPARAGSSS